MTARARRTDSGPRHTVYFRRTISASIGAGYDYEITDEHTGLVVRSGWVAGTVRDVAAEARLALSELEGKS